MASASKDRSVMIWNLEQHILETNWEFSEETKRIPCPEFFTQVPYLESDTVKWCGRLLLSSTPSHLSLWAPSKDLKRESASRVFILTLTKEYGHLLQDIRRRRYDSFHS